MQVESRRLAIISLALVAFGFAIILVFQSENPSSFEGNRALADVAFQTELGPRVVGSEAHDHAVTWIMSSLRSAGWQVEIQDALRLGHPIRNVIAKRGVGQPWIIVGAHYDSRMLADKDTDPAAQGRPVPGANDGASGVAVLLELARVLPRNLNEQVWLVFFDAEDNGRIEGWDWILGSRAFAESLTVHPDRVVILDMIGDSDLQIYWEANSDPTLRQQIWQQAAELGHDDVFLNEEKYPLLDDHTPFLELGIPAVDIIDFDYPYWHSTQDTLDKVSAESLQAVGETILAWVISQ